MNKQPYAHKQNTVLGEPVFDALGREVKVGDLIAIGIRSGDTGDLVLGTVTGFGERKERIRTNVRQHEPEFEDSRTIDPNGPDGWQRRYLYEPPTFDHAVTVKVTYESPLGKGSYKNGKNGYTTAYNRRFVVVDR